MNTKARNRKGGIHCQRGVVIFIALIMLVAMSIAGISLMRSVGGGSLVAGNLSLKQATTRASDVGVQAAMAWFEANSTPAKAPIFLANNPASGYFATIAAPFDPLTVGDVWWNTNSVTLAALPDGLAGFESVQYVIHRMCESVGSAAAPGQNCAVYLRDRPGCSPGAPCPPILQPYYRITVRVIGAQNTESFTETVMY